MLTTDQSIKILIVDDDEDDFYIISDYIRGINPNRFVLHWCFNYLEALTHMKNHNYDLYFVDYRLGIKTGLELLKEAISFNCDEPIVLLTGKGNYKVDMEAMQAGAVDYLIKTELTSEKLERCIRYALERFASTKALKANERKYRNMFERSKDAVFICNEDCTFLDVNTATSKLLGYSKKELQEQNLCELIVNKTQRDAYIDLLKEKGEVNDMEVELLTRQHTFIYCILSASTEIDTDGSKYVQGIMHDITNLKKAEKATLQAEKLAAAGRLVRTLAHEVRNPLNNINLSVDQLNHIASVEDNAFLLEIIQRNSKRIGGLITELLDSSRPVELMMEKQPLQGIMDDTIAAAIDRITLQKINIDIEYSDEPALIMADREKLKIAFLNIIINAVEAIINQPGHIKIKILSGEGRHIVQITDNGSGISEENLSRLFEPYFTSKRNGMGLGLASTLTILQAHKATVDVQSKLDHGTTFTMTFEVAPSEQDEETMIIYHNDGIGQRNEL
ncbi:MAG TPA: ATP-binding protein [Chitinophagaceae bacterium]|nr:ATP-binding protein [Chitinophagaceae bacterium]